MAAKTETRLVLVRHGETAWSDTGQHTGRTDIELTDGGKKQAAKLHELLARWHFAAVYTSPLSRARETARLAGLNAVVNDDLSEMNYGSYEGLTSAQIRATIPDWTVWTHPCPGGETLHEVADRAKRMMAVARQTDGDVCLVSHGHFLRVLACVWMQMPPANGRHFMLDAASVSLLAFEHEIPAIKLWNLTEPIYTPRFSG